MKTNHSFPAIVLSVTLVTFAYAQNAADAVIRAFRTDLAGKVKTADKNYNSVIQGKDGWMFFVPELRSLSVGKFWGEQAFKVSQAVDPKFADPLPAILDFKAQLDKAGVKLLLVPVPPKSVIYPDKLSSRIAAPAAGKLLSRVDSAHQEFYNLLRRNDIAVLDLTDEFLKKRGNGLFCKQDSHWSGRGCVEAAQSIAAVLKSTGSIRFATRKYSSLAKTVKIKGDLWDALPRGVKRPLQESLPLRFVGTPDLQKKSTLVPVPSSQSRPVLLLGDSHTLIFHEGGDMHTKGAGLVDQLAFELGMPIDLLGVRGSGATPARTSLMRRVRKNPQYLKNKKWIIWCFSAHEWTESAGWQKVPVVK